MLLKDAIESLLRDEGVRVWAFGRDQAGDQRSVGTSLKERVRECAAVIILLSRFTLQSGATQWMELAYADAFGIPAFILLHHLTFEDLKRAEPGAPPLVLEGQCTLAVDFGVRWKMVSGLIVSGLCPIPFSQPEVAWDWAEKERSDERKKSLHIAQ
jgi:hypothetical protein